MKEGRKKGSDPGLINFQYPQSSLQVSIPPSLEEAVTFIWPPGMPGTHMEHSIAEMSSQKDVPGHLHHRTNISHCVPPEIICQGANCGGSYCPIRKHTGNAWRRC